MSAAPTPPAGTAARPSFAAAPRHPAGLLYTLLRHGKGLSHEEARRISMAAAEANGPFARKDKS